MDHAEFVAAWRSARVRVDVDAAAAAAFLSARLLLPFVGIAVIGLGIALILWGRTWIGLSVGAVGIIVPRMIKRGARSFLLGHIATDADLYRAALHAGVLRIVDAAPPNEAVEHSPTPSPR